MSTSLRLVMTAAATFGLLALAGCAIGPGDSPAPTSQAIDSWDEVVASPPAGRVIGVGTVIDAEGAVQLCLGAVMESYPPQCHGLPLSGWTWQDVDGHESSGETRWGTYAVTGTYDGETLAVTDPPIMLALYDTIAPEDPTGGVDGTTSDDDLARISDELATDAGAEALSVGTRQGYVWVAVAWDDGTLQRTVDAAYGEDVVIVESALREIDG